MSFQFDRTFVVRDGDFFSFLVHFEKSNPQSKGPKSGCQVCWGDVYAVAMNAIGPLPLQTAPEEYGEFGPWVDPHSAKMLSLKYPSTFVGGNSLGNRKWILSSRISIYIYIALYDDSMTWLTFLVDHKAKRN